MNVPAAHPTHNAVKRGLEFTVIALIAAALVIGPYVAAQQGACVSNVAVYGGCHVDYGAIFRGLAIAILGGLGKALVQFLEILRDHMFSANAAKTYPPYPSQERTANVAPTDRP